MNLPKAANNTKIPPMSFNILLKWSQQEFSQLPWRSNRSLYGTLVSEIMLQQTTVSTVLKHFERFLKRFPNIESLAEASEDELTVAWKGLGYYRRARNLKKIAEEIVHEHQSQFPIELDHLMSIPGIGPYTANALLAIGMDKRAVAVDANLERVLARFYGIKEEKGPKLQKAIYQLFEQKKILNDKISFRALNEALMDLGRTYCQARKASCELCPLRVKCKAFQTGNPLSLPLEKNGEKKKAVEHELHLLRVLVTKKNEVLVYQKAKHEWLSGQFEVPTFILSTTDKSLKQYPLLSHEFKADFVFRTSITKYKIVNSVILMSEKEFKQLSFPVKAHWRVMDLESSNFSTATLKLLAKAKV